MTCAHSASYIKGDRIRCALCDLADAKDALGKYGAHSKGCAREEMQPCNCGFVRTLESLTNDTA
jgi:hypothetical protein